MVDLLFIILMMVISQTKLMAIESKKTDIKNKAEFLITLTWEDNSADDVDIWLEDPLHNVLFFRNKEIPSAHLDRDDLGLVNDTIIMPNGEKVANYKNQEIVTIRNIIAGEWVVNIHMYRKNETDPTPVEVKIDKLNPGFETLVLKRYVMAKFWEEITVCRLTMSSQGDIVGMDDLYKKLIRSTSPGTIN